MIDKEDRYGTRKRQIELLRMIKDIDAILQKHGVKYSLHGGTLLGAVRDNGFIPWDDDIDIIVDRDNFNKLVDAFKTETGSEYVLNDYLWVRRIQRSDDSRVGILKTTIDVFVADHCPDNILLQKLKLFLIKMLQGMMKVERDISGVSYIYKLCLIATGLLGKVFTARFKLRMYDSVSQIGNGQESKYLGIYNELFKYLGLKYDSKMLAEYMTTQFEDTNFPIIKEYDYYLKLVYGDYMTPPPEEERKPLHL